MLICLAWHPTSTLVHESSLAVAHVDSEKFWAYSNALFTNQNEYFDTATASEGRNATYKRLNDLAKSSVGLEIIDLLKIKSSSGEHSNLGNQITNDLKYFIKFGRQNGVHVTPTVAVDGIIDNSISSSWNSVQWNEYLSKLS